MSATKATTTLLASTANTAGSTTTSSARTATTDYGSSVTAIITNGATAPTLPCVATLQVSYDGTNYYPNQQGTAGLTNSAVYTFNFVVDAAVQYFRVQFSGNTVQSVSCVALASSLTGI